MTALTVEDIGLDDFAAKGLAWIRLLETKATKKDQAPHLPMTPATPRLSARRAGRPHQPGPLHVSSRKGGIPLVLLHGFTADSQSRTPLEKAIGPDRALVRIDRVIIAPFSDPEEDPVKVIAAAAGAFISGVMKPGMTVGVGRGRPPYNTLPFISGETLEDYRVVWLLGGIATARRFNPAEFAWQVAELFQAEGYLIPAPALVDSPETWHALLERCGLSAIFELANKLDVTLLSVGGISTMTTSYRTGYISKSDLRSLIDAGTVGDVLYNSIDENGIVVAHDVNQRVMSVNLANLRRTAEPLLISGGREMRIAMPAAQKTLSRPH